MSLLQHRFNPWPGTSAFHGCGQKKKKKGKKEEETAAAVRAEPDSFHEWITIIQDTIHIPHPPLWHGVLRLQDSMRLGI